MRLTDEEQRRLQALFNEAPNASATRSRNVVSHSTDTRWSYEVVRTLENVLGPSSTLARTARRHVHQMPERYAVEELCVLLAAVLDSRKEGYDLGASSRPGGARPSLWARLFVFGVLAAAVIAAGIYVWARA
jgi:hypothetical protein